jgi:IS5 family transposase
MLGISGWRQVKHLYKKIKKLAQAIGRLAASKSRHKKDAMTSAYADLLSRCELLILRAKSLVQTARDSTSSESVLDLAKALDQWLNLTGQVCNTAHRRVMLGEKVPNCEKLFSLFETHTQLYRRGKAGEPNQYGRMVLVYEDGAGFISHYHLMDREQRDPDVIVEQTKVAQSKHSGTISTASFDRGFHSSANETALHDVVATTCIYPRQPGQYAKKIKNESVGFHRIRLKHSGVEAAIGVLQRGNGLKRCWDRGELSFERYLGLAIMGRNIQTLGKMLIAMRQSSSAAGFSKRKAA